MSEIKHIIRRMQSRLHNINLTWNRALRHSRTAITAISGLLEVLSVIAAIGCLLCATLYIGFEREANELRTLLVYFRTFQCIFLAKVLFNLIFNLKNTIENTRVIKWIVDITLLSTLLPALYPRPANPWIPWLEDVLYSNKFLLGILVAFAIVEISYFVIRIMGKRTNPSLILSCSFLFFIFLGSFLLMMPRCTYHGIGYIDSLFVSTSAVCITGLTTIDVASTFTPLGLLILGLLIQIGGLGVMTFTSFFALFFSGNTSVYSQLMVKDMIYSKTINALLPTLLYILGFTVIVELIGAFFIWLSILQSSRRYGKSGVDEFQSDDIHCHRNNRDGRRYWLPGTCKFQGGVYRVFPSIVAPHKSWDKNRTLGSHLECKHQDCALHHIDYICGKHGRVFHS